MTTVAISYKDKAKTDIFVNVNQVRFAQLQKFTEAVMNDDITTVLLMCVQPKLNLDDHPISELSKVYQQVLEENSSPLAEYLEMKKAAFDKLATKLGLLPS